MRQAFPVNPLRAAGVPPAPGTAWAPSPFWTISSRTMTAGRTPHRSRKERGQQAMPAKCSQIRADGRNASGRVTVPLRAKTPNTRDSEGLAGRPLNPLPPLLSSSGRDARHGGSAGRQPLPRVFNARRLRTVSRIRDERPSDEQPYTETGNPEYAQI